MKLALDTHTHTLASGHAYSTLAENMEAASNRGLELLCMTDHAPSLPDSPDAFHFMNFHVLPREVGGVKMLYGAELNIMDAKGTVDLPETILKRLDFCIASYHTACTPAGSLEANTGAYLGAMDNPYVAVIGHPEDGNIPVDFERLVRGAKAGDVMLEVNNASLKSAFFRKDTRKNLTEMLRLCEAYGVYASIGTDAHFAASIGCFDEAEALLGELGFPEELVANTSAGKFLSLLAKRARTAGR